MYSSSLTVLGVIRVNTRLDDYNTITIWYIIYWSDEVSQVDSFYIGGATKTPEKLKNRHFVISSFRHFVILSFCHFVILPCVPCRAANSRSLEK